MNVYENAQAQMNKAFETGKHFDGDKNKLPVIMEPQRIIEIRIPVKMDDGSVKVFTGYRSQHNDARWPFKWGIRFHQDVDKHEVMALSIWMSIKCTVVGIPLGGWKGGVIVNPKELSESELEQLSRGYVRQLYKYIGPGQDVPAPDVNTNPKIMAWMMDEYSLLVGKYSPGSFTGKPMQAGWSAGRWAATAQGWVYVLQKILELKEQSIDGKKIIIQWAGNAGLTMAWLMVDLWATIIWISDSKGAIYNKDGIDIEEIKKIKNNRESVINYKDADSVWDKEILEKECDILIPAALENQITEKNAKDIKAKLILELANGPTTPEADEILYGKWTSIIPDILANAGGVMVSYFEQVQNDMNFYWEAEEVQEKLHKKITQAAADVYKTASEHESDMRTGAYIIAMKKIFEAMWARHTY